MKPEYNKWISGKGAGVYSAFDISSYIIEYSNEKQYIISGLKLQKLLYFVQAYFLMQKKGTLFPGEADCVELRTCSSGGI